ncbi:MAG: hypothetical protein AAB209_03815 [Bacteroidota bacterium]
MKSKARNKLIRQYLQYFQWFLEEELTVDELDYMLHLRDRIHELRGDLGDLDAVWRANAKKMLRFKSVFNIPMSEKWWWRKEVWQRLSSTRTKPKNQKRKVVRLSYHP